MVRYHTPQAAIKLAPNWDGPYVIDTVVSETTVLLRSARGRLYKSNVDRIRHWYGVELSQSIDLLQPNDDATDPNEADTGVKAILTNNKVAGGVPTTVQAPKRKSREPARRRRKRQKEARLVQGVEVLDAPTPARMPRKRGRPKSKLGRTPSTPVVRVVSTPESRVPSPIVEKHRGMTDTEQIPLTPVGRCDSRRRKRRRAGHADPPIVTPKTKPGPTGGPAELRVPGGPMTRARTGGRCPPLCPGIPSNQPNATTARVKRGGGKQKVTILPCTGERTSARLAGKRVNT